MAEPLETLPLDAVRRGRMESRLLEDPLGNIMALKFLSLLGARSQGGLTEVGHRWATWFHYPPSAFPFDASLYADKPRIAYWNANDEERAQESMVELPPGVVKVSTQPCLSLAEARWPALRSFRWFSRTEALPEPRLPVRRYDRVVEDLFDLSRTNGYDGAALAEQEARGCRWFLGWGEGGPQSICYLQPNFGSLWEVSGVFVRPEARGRGWAQAVVTAAVNDLLARGFVPRYFVDDQNLASLGVVRSLGLVERGRTVHFAVGSDPEA